jgi:hypothetical protein
MGRWEFTLAVVTYWTICSATFQANGTYHLYMGLVTFPLSCCIKLELLTRVNITWSRGCYKVLLLQGQNP